MPRVFIDSNELYPFYYLLAPGDGERYDDRAEELDYYPSLEVDDDTLSRWKEVRSQFEALQKELRTLEGKQKCLIADPKRDAL